VHCISGNAAAYLRRFCAIRVWMQARASTPRHQAFTDAPMHIIHRCTSEHASARDHGTRCGRALFGSCPGATWWHSGHSVDTGRQPGDSLADRAMIPRPSPFPPGARDVMASFWHLPKGTTTFCHPPGPCCPQRTRRPVTVKSEFTSEDSPTAAMATRARARASSPRIIVVAQVSGRPKLAPIGH